MWQSLNNFSLASSFTRVTSLLVPRPLLKIFIVSCPANFFHLFSDNFPLAKSVQFWIISSESSRSLGSEVTPRAFGPSGHPKTYGRQSAWSHRLQSGFKLKTDMLSFLGLYHKTLSLIRYTQSVLAYTMQNTYLSWPQWFFEWAQIGTDIKL